MKKSITVGLVIAIIAAASVCHAQELPEMPKPTKEHEWLEQLVGEWETETEAVMEPGQPPLTAKGTESVRSLGGFWVLSEGEGTMMNMPVKMVMTLGYDGKGKKYVGTFIGSCDDYLWKYEGTVDPTGKMLTLLTEGPCPMKPGQISKFKEVLEFKDKDHKVFTSSIQDDDGKWQKMVTMDARRKK